MSMIIAVTLAIIVAEGSEIEVRTLADGAKSPPARIEDVAWMAGRWIGDGLGGCSEESMSPAVGGQMMGMFRQTKADGSLWFYEFYTIAEKAGSITFRIKHFNPDFTGWEEKDGYVEFPLVALGDGVAYFDGLTYQRDGKKGLKAAVNIGDSEQGVFNLHAARADEVCPSTTRP